MLKKHILIRAYGGHLMGMGHLYRMKLVIEQLKSQQSVHVSLLTRTLPESVNLYRSLNADHVFELSEDVSETEELAYLQTEMNGPYDLILNDQLNSSNEIAAALLRLSPNILSMDDTGSGAEKFQQLINVLYTNKVPHNHEENSFQYLILSNFEQYKTDYCLKNKVSRIFINQGAADTWGAIPDIILDLNKINDPIILRVLLGPAFQHYTELGEALKETRHRIELFNSTGSVVSIAKNCDLAILGIGNTLFEVASIGVPVIGCTRETKELLTMRRLLDEKLIEGKLSLYHDYSVAETVRILMENTGKRQEISDACREEISYNGLEKIVKKVRAML